MEFVFSDRLKNLEGNAIREIFKLISKPGIISFAGGLPANEALPVDDIKEIANNLLSGPKKLTLLQYGATEGYQPYLEAGIEYVKRVGINDVKKDQIIAISGGQQGIDLVCKAFINKGDVVLVEDPTYLAVLHILKTYEAVAIGVKSGPDGLDLADLELKIKKHNPKLLYIVPTFSNPTGKTIDGAKRIKIAEITAKNNVVVVEDNPYGELRFKGKAEKAIKAFDACGNVIYLTSFSKTISPGMRVGLAVGDASIIRKMTIGKQATDVHTALINQAIVAEFLNLNKFQPMIDKHLPLYGEKCQAMLAAMDKYFPKEVNYTRPEGGLFIWVELPKNISANEMFMEAVENNVAYVSGDAFFADGCGKNTFRLNYSNASLENIDKGIKILGSLIEKRL